MLSRYHPAIHALRDIVQSDKLGKIKHVEAALRMPDGIGITVKNDNRLRYDIGGGCMMDMGGTSSSSSFLSYSSQQGTRI